MTGGLFLTSNELDRESAAGLEILYTSRPTLTKSRQLLMLDAVLQPGVEHAPHFHPRQEEILYVISGELEAWLGGQHRIVSAGDVVFIPPGTPHRARNASRSPTRVIAVTSPCIGETGHEAVPVEDE